MEVESEMKLSLPVCQAEPCFIRWFHPVLRSFLLIQIKYSVLNQHAAPVVADGQRKRLDRENMKDTSDGTYR
jgi:hypothetical protein